MGKAAMCMKMLQILNTGRVYKCSELASLLDTNSRNIIEYKKELEEAGYYIISIPGKYGGYKLDKSDTFPSLKLKEEERKALIDSLEFILSRKEFVLKKSFHTGMSKVLSSFLHTYESQFISVKDNDFDADDEQLKNIYLFFEKCIKAKKVTEITYIDYLYNEKTCLFHPYKLIHFEDNWKVIGWNAALCDVEVIDINKIINYVITTKSFTVYKYFDLYKYLDPSNLTKKEAIQIEFISSRKVLYSIIDNIKAKDLIIVEQNQDKIKVKLTIFDEEYIARLFLGYLGEVEVVSPSSLKDKIANLFEQLRRKL